jgi:hypothetical protein
VGAGGSAGGVRDGEDRSDDRGKDKRHSIIIYPFLRSNQEEKMYFSIDTEIHFKISKLCYDLIDEFHPFSKKYPYVSNIGRKNLINFRKSFEWGLCQEIDEILRCYPHSPNFFEPSIEHSLNSLFSIKAFLVHTNSQSSLLEKTKSCWDESIELIK